MARERLTAELALAGLVNVRGGPGRRLVGTSDTLEAAGRVGMHYGSVVCSSGVQASGATHVML